MVSRISLFHVDFVFAVFVTIQTKMCTLQHLIVVIRFCDINPISEADDRIPWGKSCFPVSVGICIIGEFQTHVIFESWTSRIVGRQIIQRCLVSQRHFLSIGIFLFRIKIRELSVHDCFDILDNHLESIFPSWIGVHSKFPFFQRVAFPLFIGNGDLHTFRLECQGFVHLVMPCVVIGLVSVHVWNVGLVFVRNSLADLIVPNVIPAVFIRNVLGQIILLDFFDHTWIIGFDLHFCRWVCCTHHTKRSCRVCPFHIRNFIHQIIAER